MALVAGVDSSTQSCKVVVREADTGRLVRSGRAPHPAGTSVEPAAWQRALDTAVTKAGGLGDVSAISVAAQQHGMVCLDEDGRVVRDALLWNDTRSAQAAADLVAELPGGAAEWAATTGSVPVASFTVAKLRWLAEHEPANAARTAAVCLPHDWLSWQLRGSADLSALATDRGDASGTGYWSPSLGEYRLDLLQLAFGGTPAVPVVLGPTAPAGATASGVTVGPGTGDNAAAALGVGAEAGDMIISIGTSGVVSAVSSVPVADPSGLVAGFADASGHFLPLACTLNGVGVLHAAARMLRVSIHALSDLALSAKPGADGLVFVPYLEGERTPNRPDATGALHGLTASNSTASNVARAAIEGLLCGLADCLDVIRGAGVPLERLLLVGGGARSQAIRQLAPTVLCTAVHALEPAEYVADGAALQAAWVISASAVPPAWPRAGIATYDAPSRPDLRDRYATVRELTSKR